VFGAMKKLYISTVSSESGGTYPSPFDEPCIAQSCQRLARFAGLTQFEELLRAGDCAAFRRGDPDGHHLVNGSDQPARVNGHG